MSRIGFMQGRLSPLVDGRIQAFPWPSWEQEFSSGAHHGLRCMEWTLDQDRLYENPLLTSDGQSTIRQLCATHGFVIPSLTGDCFMQAPLWKSDGDDRARLERDFLAVVQACAAVGISMIVVPLVDNGRLETESQTNVLLAFLHAQAATFVQSGVQVVFESDFAPDVLARLMESLDASVFGVNYDMGNSAALGYNPEEEIAAYGDRILNVHVKDRLLGGTTVPLGTGQVDFDAVFAALGRAHYTGRYILQTARATDEDHIGVLTQYRDMTATWVHRHGA